MARILHGCGCEVDGNVVIAPCDQLTAQRNAFVAAAAKTADYLFFEKQMVAARTEYEAHLLGLRAVHASEEARQANGAVVPPEPSAELTAMSTAMRTVGRKAT